jgi:hypothetical protein
MGMNTLRNYRWSQRAQASLRFQRLGLPRPGLRRPALPRPRRGAAGAPPVQRAPRNLRNPQAAVYWRRRFVALMIGLAVLALIAWAFSGAIGGGGPAAGTSSGSSGSGRSQQGHGGSGANGGGSQAGAAAATTPASRGAGSRTRAGSATGRPRRRTTAARPNPCHHGDVVLSLSSSQESYSANQLPQFSVDVVATGRQTCTFNVGASHVALVIRSGPVRVWSSADCVQGAGDLVSDLQRGVPTMLSISWNRQASSPGCPAPASRMPAGAYTATVADGSLASNTVDFRIS